MKSITQLDMLRQRVTETDDDFADDDCDVKMSRNRRTDRKKRRGVIEKKRRDRINNSLSELKRLVPSAYEKQGSTKLEKAEILQMTVDHLQLLNAKGLNGFGVDPSSLALDYRSVGFRECVSEVARYLAAVEGMDLQDPLRMRMLGHLETYSAQRDVTAKANLQSFNSWGTWSRFHSTNTAASFGHSKYTSYHHGFTANKSGLGLLGSNIQQSNDMDSNTYLAASRLGSTLGFTSPKTPTNLCHMTQTIPTQQTSSCHFPSLSCSLAARDNHSNTAPSHFAGHGFSGSANTAASMKLVRGFSSDMTY